MIIRVRTEDVEWFREHPQLWWANAPRWALGRIGVGEGGVEIDESGDPTGWLLYADHRFDAWDQLTFDVCLAGKAYVLSLGDNEQAAQIVQYQLHKDLQAFQKLIAEAPDLDARILAVKKEIVRQANALGVPLPDMDEDFNIIEPEAEEIFIEEPEVDARLLEPEPEEEEPFVEEEGIFDEPAPDPVAEPEAPVEEVAAEEEPPAPEDVIEE